MCQKFSMYSVYMNPFHPYNGPLRSVLLPSFYRFHIRVFLRLSNFKKFWQPVNGRVRIQIQAIWLHNACKKKKKVTETKGN